MFIRGDPVQGEDGDVLARGRRRPPEAERGGEIAWGWRWVTSMSTSTSRFEIRGLRSRTRTDRSEIRPGRTVGAWGTGSGSFLSLTADPRSADYR